MNENQLTLKGKIYSAIVDTRTPSCILAANNADSRIVYINGTTGIIKNYLDNDTNTVRTRWETREVRNLQLEAVVKSYVDAAEDSIDAVEDCILVIGGVLVEGALNALQDKDYLLALSYAIEIEKFYYGVSKGTDDEVYEFMANAMRAQIPTLKQLCDEKYCK